MELPLYCYHFYTAARQKSHFVLFLSLIIVPYFRINNFYSDAKEYVFMPLSSLVIIGQTGMKCRKNWRNVKLHYTNNIYLKVFGIFAADTLTESGKCRIAATVTPLLSISDFTTIEGE